MPIEPSVVQDGRNLSTKILGEQQDFAAPPRPSKNTPLARKSEAGNYARMVLRLTLRRGEPHDCHRSS